MRNVYCNQLFPVLAFYKLITVPTEHYEKIIFVFAHFINSDQYVSQQTDTSEIDLTTVNCSI